LVKDMLYETHKRKVLTTYRKKRRHYQSVV